MSEDEAALHAARAPVVRAVTAAVVVAGEALVDLVPRGDGALDPLPGGSPANVAVGLARAGITTAYLGGLSTDGFGDLLRRRFETAGVDLALATSVEQPTTLAVVHLDDDARASYRFYLDGTAATSLTVGDLPILPASAALHVSFGAIGPTHPGTGEALVHLARRESRRRTVCLDPNVRPSAIADLDDHRRRLDDLVRYCGVVKVSDEDLTLLYPDLEPEEVAEAWATTGPALVVVTRGPDGAVGFGVEGRIEVPGRPVEVVDTVGAGDAFTAGLLAALHRGGHLAADRIDHLDVATATAAIQHAVHVAAVTCTRAGADPPTAAELEGS